MLSRYNTTRNIWRSQKRAFSASRNTLIDIKSHNSVYDTINHIDTQGETDADFKSAQPYFDIINHHASRLSNIEPTASSSSEVANKEYNDLYTLSLKLSNLLETTPDVPEEFKKDILNNLIEKFTKYNYAVSTLAFKQLLNKKENLSINSINELINHNPGRVNSSWELYNNFKPNGNHDQILITVLKKLLFGDAVEIKEGLEKVDADKFIKIFQIYQQINDKTIIDNEIFIKLVKDLIQLESTALITQMNIPSSIFEMIISNSDDYNLKNEDFLYFYESSINNGVSLSGNSLLKILMPISKLQLNPIIQSENLKKILENLNIQLTQLASLPEIVDEIREQIQELNLDDNSIIMFNLIKSAGFYSNNLQIAIKYFQNFQSKIPDGTQEQNDLKSIMSLIFVYDAINKEDYKMIQVAEALVPQSPLPAASNLASLILYQGWIGDSDKAFDIYNKSLDLYLKPLEEYEIERGMLVQSLAIVSLLGKEIGLAKLIKDKSLQNKLINETYEIKLSNLFKEYGEKIEQCKDDGAFRNSMKSIFLRSIIEYSP